MSQQASKATLSTKDITKTIEVDIQQKQEVQEWIEAVLNIKIEKDLFDELKNGVILCELLNKIKPNTCKKYKQTKIAFVARTNIQIYLKGCRSLGIPEMDCFESNDLFDGQRLHQVLLNIYSLSAISRKYNFQGPFIGSIKYSEKNKREFTQEILNKSKSSVPIWNKGGNEIKTKSIDAYGIIKTEKEMQSHSSVPSVWEKGANEIKTQSIDGYGIVKAPKELQKHSGVLNKWEKGSNEIKTKSIDAYGIIKTEKDMQSHSNVSSVWEQGSNQTSTASNLDSYGIVKQRQTDNNNNNNSNNNVDENE